MTKKKRQQSPATYTATIYVEGANKRSSQIESRSFFPHPHVAILDAVAFMFTRSPPPGWESALPDQPRVVELVVYRHRHDGAKTVVSSHRYEADVMGEDGFPRIESDEEREGRRIAEVKAANDLARAQRRQQWTEAEQ